MPKTFFAKVCILKIGLKMNLSVIPKSYAAYPEIEFPTKSVLQLFELRSSFRQRGS